MFMDTSVGKWCETFGVLTFSDKPMSLAKYPAKVAHLICAPIIPRFAPIIWIYPKKNSWSKHRFPQNIPKSSKVGQVPHVYWPSLMTIDDVIGASRSNGPTEAPGDVTKDTNSPGTYCRGEVPQSCFQPWRTWRLGEISWVNSLMFHWSLWYMEVASPIVIPSVCGLFKFIHQLTTGWNMPCAKLMQWHRVYERSTVVTAKLSPILLTTLSYTGPTKASCLVVENSARHEEKRGHHHLR